MNLTYDKLYHNSNEFSTFSPQKHESFYAVVQRSTASGCILLLLSEGGAVALAFAFGNYRAGDYLVATVTKVFDNGRYPRVCVDTVLEYASGAETINNCYAYSRVA